jgi:hypothetical protein
MHVIQQTDYFLCEVQDEAEETVQLWVYVVRYHNQVVAAVIEVNTILVSIETKILFSVS